MKKLVLIFAIVLTCASASFASATVLKSAKSVVSTKNDDFKVISYTVTYSRKDLGNGFFKPAYTATITVTSADGKISITVTSTSDISASDALNKAYAVASLALKLTGN